VGTWWRTTHKKIWKRVVSDAIFNLQQLRKILATKESVTGVTRSPSKDRSNSRKHRVCKYKSASWSTNKLGAFIFYIPLSAFQFNLDKKLSRPTFAALNKSIQVYGKIRAALKIKEL
jgi:hypothetical protein